jgi:hypothetical protein
MLALDDAALARFVRVAKKISVRKRGRWLQEIAKQLDPGSRSRKNAEWCRVSRLRAKNGVVAFRVVLDRVALEETLIAESLLRAGVEHSHAAIEDALQYFLDALIAVSTDDITVGQGR